MNKSKHHRTSRKTFVGNEVFPKFCQVRRNYYFLVRYFFVIAPPSANSERKPRLLGFLSENLPG